MSEQLCMPVIAHHAKISGPIVEQLLSHLNDETSSLLALLDAVREVNTALIALDDSALRESLEAEVRELAANAEIQQRRRRIREELGTLLQVDPVNVTLRRLVTMTSGALQDSIDRAWRSLLEMAREMERLNRQNAAMLSQSLAIARGVVEQLTGMTAVNESYSATGTRASTHVGPLVQWGG